MKPGSWERRVYAMAESVAQWSKDPERRVGAVLTRDRCRVMFTGYNGFPARIPDDPVMLNDRAVRLELTVHAEENALLNAAGQSLEGWTLYVTEHPCRHCALLLVSAGVSRVVCPPYRPESRWAESQRSAAYVLRTSKTDLVLL